MMRKKSSAQKTIRDIRRATRRHYSAEEKIRIVLEGLRGEDTIAELCRREGLNSNVYYRWSKEFMEAGKKRLAGDTAREATSDEVKQLRAESSALKETLGELLMENRLLKKSMLGDGVPQNNVRAYAWWSVAVAQGNEDARGNRELMADRLSSEQLARGQDMATRCFESDFQDCE